MAEPVLDNCGNCKYWDTRDKNLEADERRDGLGVCRIQSYADEFENDLAYVSGDDEDSGLVVLVTDEQFFCNLYKVGK